METISQLNDLSRIWIFTSDRQVTDKNIIHEIKLEAQKFCAQWTAHKVALHADADFLYGQFLIIGVDEDKHGASGCSIDTMHTFIKNLGNTYGFNFLDRMRIVYLSQDNSTRNVSLNEFISEFREGRTSGVTPVFNTLISSGRDLTGNFIIPAKASWLGTRLNL